MTVLAANERQSLDAVRLKVETFLNAQHENTQPKPRIKVSKLDPRLRLAACTQPLTIGYVNPNRNLGAIFVSVGCPDSSLWEIYVRAEVKAFAGVLVATRSIAGSSKIQASDIRLEKYDLGRLHAGYFQNIDELKGLETKHSLRAGQVLNPNQLRPRKLIRNGETVTMLLDINGLQVRSQGQALHDASAGQRVRIRNLSSGRVIEGHVLSEGLVGIRQ